MYASPDCKTECIGIWTESRHISSTLQDWSKSCCTTSAALAHTQKRLLSLYDTNSLGRSLHTLPIFFPPSRQCVLHLDTGRLSSCCGVAFCAARPFKRPSLTFSWHLVSPRLYQANVWAATALNWHEPCSSSALDRSMPPSYLGRFRKMPPVQLKNLPPLTYAASELPLSPPTHPPIHPVMIMAREV